MIEDVVKVLIKKIISSDYPHLKMPSVVFAKISSAKICGTYEVNDLTITNKTTEQTFSAQITADTFEYSLQVIDRFGNVDDSFPVLPGIKSKKPFQTGAVVAVAFAYGDIEPVIIGEVSL